MTCRDHLIEQHILQNASHLKYIDEMLRRAHEQVDAGKAPPQAQEELSELKSEREKLAGQLTEMKHRGPEEWDPDTLKQSGPIGIWDAVARRLEKLVDRLD